MKPNEQTTPQAKNAEAPLAEGELDSIVAGADVPSLPPMPTDSLLEPILESAAIMKDVADKMKGLT